MGGFAQTCIRILTGWVESLISQIWAISSDPKGSNLVTWIGENWKGIFLALCVAGAAIDLVVYLFRWEPVRVWKSYFRRRKNRNRVNWPAAQEYAAYDEDDIPEPPQEQGPYFARNREQPVPDVPYIPEDPYLPEDETEPQPQTAPVAGPVYAAPGVQTPPAYQDAYRRPEQQAVPPAAGQSLPEGGSMTERNLEKVIGPRRRRIRMNELFGDPGEAVGQYEAPQPVIDQNEAYHAPVYPRNWKENGDAEP